MGLEARKYVVDPEDPRAPPDAIWDAMSEAEREEVCAALPSEVPFHLLPDGDLHLDAMLSTRDVLKRHVKRRRKGLYIANNLMVYYPTERSFAPDLFAVRDVPLHPRRSWMVRREGRGLDFALEIHVEGSKKKDFLRNPALFARLGIHEYFAVDLPRRMLRGYRLPDSNAAVYQSLVPQGGMFYSEILDLEIGLEGDRVRFFSEGAPMLETHEIAVRAQGALDEAMATIEREHERAEAERERAEAERERAEAERERADQAEAALAALQRQLAALKSTD